MRRWYTGDQDSAKTRKLGENCPSLGWGGGRESSFGVFVCTQCIELAVYVEVQKGLGGKAGLMEIYGLECENPPKLLLCEKNRVLPKVARHVGRKFQSGQSIDRGQEPLSPQAQGSTLTPLETRPKTCKTRKLAEFSGFYRQSASLGWGRPFPLSDRFQITTH